MSKRQRRLWKVSWFNPTWNERQGASYTTREAAVRRGQSQADEGCDSVRVWESDGTYVVGPMERIEPAS